MKIALGCDHAGFNLREAVLNYLNSKKIECLDFGAKELNNDDDYPDVAFKVAYSVSEEEAGLGILLCGTGFGVAISANKVSGIRAMACNNIESAKSAKRHLNLNVITLGGRFVKPEEVAGILDAWLNTEFEGGRHLRRVNKISLKDGSVLSANVGDKLGRVVIFNHPLIQHKLGKIRDAETSSVQFRELLREITGLMVYEITRDFPLEEIEVTTPIAKTKAYAIKGKKLALVPVLRAGLGMLDGILRLAPNAKIGHLGLYRNPETLEPVEYFCKLPSDIAEREIMILDPMLATGGTATASISMIKKHGGQKISLVCLIAAPEGLSRVQKEHPEVNIFAAALDERLNEHGYIVPGIGDAGDRIFGTL